MRKGLISVLFFLLIFAYCLAQQPNQNSKDVVQKIGYVEICDTSKICLYMVELKDTLQGKGVIRLSLKRAKCKNIKIIDGEILFLSITSKKQGDKKVLDYRYLVTESLTSDEIKAVNLYSSKLYDIFKNRGVCCVDEELELDSKKYDFPFTFTVLPKDN